MSRASPHLLTMSLAIRLFVFVVVTLASGAAIHAAENAGDIPREIGVASRTLKDPERSNWPGTGPRPVRVALWYPSAGGGTREIAEGDDQRISLWRDGNLQPSREKYPVILLSHGSGGRAAQVSWWGYFLAQHGYIVAAVDHNGTDDEELHNKQPTLTDFFGWERARDLSIALTGLLADPAFAPRIDATRIGAAGFSLGATTVLWTAGARLDLETLRLNSPPPPPPLADAIGKLIEFSKTDRVALQSVARANLSYKDARIKSVFALAPPMGAGFTAEGLRNVNVPVCIVVGDADLIAPAETNAKHFAAHIPNARLVVVSGERGHYLRPIAADQRRAELREIAAMALKFFDEQPR